MLYVSFAYDCLLSCLKEVHTYLLRDEILHQVTRDHSLVSRMVEQGRIIELNPAAEQTFGHRKGDVLGELLADLIIPERGTRTLRSRRCYHSY